MSKNQTAARKLAILFAVVVLGQLAYLAPAVAITKTGTSLWAHVAAVALVVAGWLGLNCWAAPRILERFIGSGRWR